MNNNYFNEYYDDYRNNYYNSNYSMYASSLKDFGPLPFVFNIEKLTNLNNNFRVALWTGSHLQITLMCIPAGESIGLEIHPDTDQFIIVEQGRALVQMGSNQNSLNFQREIGDNFAVVVPAGTWHNIINIGCTPLKVYSIYASPKHPKGTIQNTKSDATYE